MDKKKTLMAQLADHTSCEMAQGPLHMAHIRVHPEGQSLTERKMSATTRQIWRVMVGTFYTEHIWDTNAVSRASEF